MSMKRAIATATAVLLAAGAGAAQAQEMEAPQRSGQLTASQILQKLESEGYTNIEDLERDDGQWEAEATKPDGTRVELHLSATDGHIISEQADID